MLARLLSCVAVMFTLLAVVEPAAAQFGAQFNAPTVQSQQSMNYATGQVTDPAALNRVHRKQAILNQEKAISEYTTPYQFTRYYGYGMYRPWLYEPNFSYWYGTNQQPYNYRPQQ